MMTHSALRLPTLLAMSLALPLMIATAANARSCDAVSEGIACISAEPISTDLQPDVRPGSNPALNSDEGNVLRNGATENTAQAFQSGDVLPYQYMVLLNTARYGLPSAQDGWVYFDVDGQIYRADLGTRQVIDRVTQEANMLYQARG
ncbi:hypothetical protein DL237_06155 [Pseudooceanicola sediminis]|uniref:Uncharacterized protein n=1 Tax=Pseudooceanicola sediminis TaxID=2211117 RepID=A0A399J327_9RHOB|nr:hypothetical protein [Pseudooceanicola sediminis]KAA2317371.1 hypothetical protein E0K93_03530 [Puniceibacterium sp. HSS470]RII39724.1 hypothetical protein DL237_06155 [Pseudooceanicola sediminis]|tara:strand:+ start:13430 stop:13870 length:441 start_codon:yes stop_codon:yes gene_type:complete